MRGCQVKALKRKIMERKAMQMAKAGMTGAEWRRWKKLFKMSTQEAKHNSLKEFRKPRR